MPHIGLDGIFNYAKWLTVGLSLWFFVYLFVNASMVSGILPVNEIPMLLTNAWWHSNDYLNGGFWHCDVDLHTQIIFLELWEIC